MSAHLDTEPPWWKRALARIGRLHPGWFAAAIAGLGIAVPLVPGWWMVLAAVILVAVVALSVASTDTEVKRLNAVIEANEAAASEAASAGRRLQETLRREGRRHVPSVVNPAVFRLRNMVELGNAAAEIVGLRQIIVDSIAHSGPEGSRSALYLLDAAGILRRETFSNHPEAPRLAFIPSDADGKYVYRLILDEQGLLADDVDEDPRVTPRGDYKTVVAVGLGTDSRRFGMLTLDAPVAGTLTRDHLNTVKMLAQLLLVGELLAGTPGYLPQALGAPTVSPDLDTVTEGEEFHHDRDHPGG